MLDAFRPVVLAPAGAAGAGAGGAVAGPEPLVRFALVRSYANARSPHGARPQPHSFGASTWNGAGLLAHEKHTVHPELAVVGRMA